MSAMIPKKFYPSAIQSPFRLGSLGILGLMAGLFFGIVSPTQAANPTPILGGVPVPFNLSDQQHFLNRSGYGATQVELARLQRLGFDGYLEQQLHPSQPLPFSLTQALAQNPLPSPQQLASQLIAINDTFKQSQDESPLVKPLKTPLPMPIALPNPILGVTPIVTMNTAPTPAIDSTKSVAKIRHEQQRQQLFKQVDTAARNRRVLLAIYNPNQLQEVMTEFWYNHFNIYSNKSDLTHLLYADYEQNAIRPYVMGKFGDLLNATAHHPAMLDYLDNRLSSTPRFDPKHPEKPAKGGINENYAREIMELHTLGVKGGYTQADVTTLAKMLTGWGTSLPSIAKGEPFVYNPKQHDTRAKMWLKNPIAVGQQQQEGEQALNVLAHAPATAQHIAYQLASYFVTDTPPPTLVKKLTQTFLTTDGDIAQLLRVIFHSPEFWSKSSYQQKFKPPFRYVISSIRNSELPQIDPSVLVNRINGMGMPLYGRISPDGYDWQQSTWLSPTVIQQRLTYATQLAQGKLFQNAKPPANPIPYRIDPAILLGNAFADIRPATLQRYHTLTDSVSKTTLLLGSPDYMNY